MPACSFICRCVLFAVVATAIHAAEPSTDNPPPIRYQKEVAAAVAEAMAGFPAAMERFEKGLPKGSELHVSVRMLDALVRLTSPEYQVYRVRNGEIEDSEWIELADVRVTKVDPVKREITGKITNKLPPYTGYERGDKITVALVNLVDWKITRLQGSEEGGMFAKFLAAKGPDTDLGRLLAEEEVAARRELLASPEFHRAIGRSFLQLFDDPALKIDYGTSRDPFVGDWPELAKKYGGLPAADVLAGLRARAEALKPGLRLEISDSLANGTIVYDVAAVVVMKKNGFVFEVRQLLQFYYEDKILKRVRWGLKTTRPIKLRKAG